MSDPVHVLESRVGNLRKYLPDAKLSVYAMSDRSFAAVCVIGVATCAEQMLDLCHEAGLTHWTLGNTVCRSIIRNVDEEGPKLLTVVGMKKPPERIRTPIMAEAPANVAVTRHGDTPQERTRLRKERRKRAKERARLEKINRRASISDDESVGK